MANLDLAAGSARDRTRSFTPVPAPWPVPGPRWALATHRCPASTPPGPPPPGARQCVTQRRDARRPGRSRTRCRSAGRGRRVCLRLPSGHRPAEPEPACAAHRPGAGPSAWPGQASRVGLRQPKQPTASCVFPGSCSADARIGVYHGTRHHLRLTTVRQRGRGERVTVRQPSEPRARGAILRPGWKSPSARQPGPASAVWRRGRDASGMVRPEVQVRALCRMHVSVAAPVNLSWGGLGPRGPGQRFAPGM
jgi:hypothetical protein